MKLGYGVLLAVALFVCAAPLCAQTGCTDSPENPTVVLGIVGAAGACLSVLRQRVRSRRKGGEG